jgi:hypothetical protein
MIYKLKLYSNIQYRALYSICDDIRMTVDVIYTAVLNLHNLWRSQSLPGNSFLLAG